MNFSVDRLLVLVSLVPVLVVSLMFHELAHGLVAYWMGDPTAKRAGRLSLNPIKHLDPLGTAMFFVTYMFSPFVFGWAKPVPVSPYYFKNRQRGMALVGLAGPATNFALAVGFAFLLNALHPAWDSILRQVLFLVFQVNIVLGIFNLIPVPPLDGSRVVGAFMPRRAYEKWVTLDRYGMFLAIIVLGFVVYTGFFRWVLENLTDVILTNYDITWR